MRLADRIAHCRAPFVVQNTRSGETTHLSGAADYRQHILNCPTRYILSDPLTRLGTALAYSRGSRTLDCADLLHVPAEHVWVEWCEAAWLTELRTYGFKTDRRQSTVNGRRGAYLQSSTTGRSGLIRTFWTTGDSEVDVLASSMEAYFDFDTAEGDAPSPPDGESIAPIRVFDHAVGRADVLRRHFRFRFERSWAGYYSRAALSPEQSDAVARHALGTIAIDIPLLLAFFLLLVSRPSIPRRPLMLERLNRSRVKANKLPLLDQVEVFSPLLPEYDPLSSAVPHGQGRRSPRLHHVRGHLVRRGSQIFWRVPHLRGNARAGVVRARTVTWSIDHAETRRTAATPQIQQHSHGIGP